MTRKPKELIDKLINIPNPDKTYHEEWEVKPKYKKKTLRNPLNIPHPFRMVLSGSVNCGKTTAIKNVLLRQDPPFQELYVIHCDGEHTKEYRDCNAKMLNSIPHPKEWDSNTKKAVVLDDIEYKNLNKQEQSNLDRLLGYCSTHKNISVFLTCQDFFNTAPSVRRMTNVFVLWKSNDEDSFKMISKKCGLKMNVFMDLFDKYIDENKRDSLWIDLSTKSPYPIRKNGFEIIKLPENDN